MSDNTTAEKPIMVRKPEALAAIARYQKRKGIKSRAAAVHQFILEGAGLGFDRRDVSASILRTAMARASESAPASP